MDKSKLELVWLLVLAGAGIAIPEHRRVPFLCNHLGWDLSHPFSLNPTFIMAQVSSVVEQPLAVVAELFKAAATAGADASFGVPQQFRSLLQDPAALAQVRVPSRTKWRG
jgi:hypothetical protein